MTLTDMSKLKVTLPFSGSGFPDIRTGQKATVYLQDLMQSVDGTVTYVGDKPYSTASGGELYNVEIMVDNPGSLTDGMKANAEIDTPEGSFTSVDSGLLSCINTSVLESDAGGTVTSVNVIENQFVNAGDVLAEMQNDSAKLTLDTDNLKLQSLQRQLVIQQQQLTYYKITAPCDGTVASVNNIAGDTVQPGNTLAVVSDMGHLQFQVSIDELDIAKVKVGQKVNITLDALPETSTTPLTGTVSDVAHGRHVVAGRYYLSCHHHCGCAGRLKGRNECKCGNNDQQRPKCPDGPA